MTEGGSGASAAPTIGVAVALLALLSATSATAQVNIERLRLEDDREGLSGAASVALTLQTGNAEKRRGDGEVRIDVARPGWRSFAIVNGDFDWTQGNRVSNRGLLHLRHIHRPLARVAPEVFGQVNYDKSRSLDLRWLVGAGARVRLRSSERGRVSLGIAYMFERERLGIPPTSGHPVRTAHHRGSSFLTLSAEPRAGLALASTSYVQPRLDALGDVRVLNESRLAVQLLGSLSLDLTLDLMYDAEPPDDTESLDAALRTGIGIRF